MSQLLIIAVALIVVSVAAWAMRHPAGEESIPPPSEAELQVALELRAIKRRLDVAQLKSEQRRSVDRLRRELAEELRDPGGAP